MHILVIITDDVDSKFNSPSPYVAKKLRKSWVHSHPWFLYRQFTELSYPYVMGAHAPFFFILTTH